MCGPQPLSDERTDSLRLTVWCEGSVTESTQIKAWERHFFSFWTTVGGQVESSCNSLIVEFPDNFLARRELLFKLSSDYLNRVYKYPTTDRCQYSSAARVRIGHRPKEAWQFLSRTSRIPSGHSLGPALSPRSPILPCSLPIMAIVITYHTECFWRELLIEKLQQSLHLGSCFFFLFMAYNTTQNLLTSLLPGIGTFHPL